MIEMNSQDIQHGLGMEEEFLDRYCGSEFNANEMVANPQASNSKSSMHAVGQTWCIREVNSSGNFIGPEFSPFRRSENILFTLHSCVSYAK